MKYTITSYPNREVRVTRVPDRFPRFPEAEVAPDSSDPKSPPEGLEECGTGDPSHEPAPYSDYLDIRSELSDPLPPAGFGRLGQRTEFGTNARRTILRAGGVFDVESIPCGECVFLTGTLPGGTPAAMMALAEHSSEVVYRLKNWLLNYVKGGLSLYVWELQKRGALHLHYCIHVPNEVMRNRILAGFRRWWCDAIAAISDKSGVDLFEWENQKGTWRNSPQVVQADAQICEKSIAGYISKYASKGPKVGGSADVTGEVYPWPARWWGVSRPLLELLKKHTKALVIDNVAFSKMAEVEEALYEIYSSEMETSHDSKKIDEQDGCDRDRPGVWYGYKSPCGKARVWVGFGQACGWLWERLGALFSCRRPSQTGIPMGGARGGALGGQSDAEEYYERGMESDEVSGGKAEQWSIYGGPVWCPDFGVTGYGRLRFVGED